MTDANVRVRRRAHPAPILVPLLVLLAAAAGVFWLGTWARTTVVIVVRHAEPAATPAGDPDLSPAGAARAELLGEFLEGVLGGDKVDYLYSGDARRAEQTAAPIANRFGLPVNLLAPSDWEGLASRIRSEHRGRTVVVVGYDSTVPNLVSQLAGSHSSATQASADAIHLIVIPSPGNTRVFTLRYGAPSRSAPAPKSQKST
ncbi:MAG: phosphoglycerate mutase family protein [Steroidobacteraceae bacterium]